MEKIPMSRAAHTALDAPVQTVIKLGPWRCPEATSLGMKNFVTPTLGYSGVLYYIEVDV